MGLLDIEYKPLYEPPKNKRFDRQTVLTQQNRDFELNNFDK